MKIYLDNCCYNRPYDDQNQLTISLETLAKLEIQRKIKEGKLKLVSSFMLRLENRDNPFENRRNATENFITLYSSEYIGADKRNAVERRAEDIIKSGVKTKDAIHAACAIEAGCDYLITTDMRFLKYKSDKIRMINPIDFLRLEDNEDGQQYD